MSGTNKGTLNNLLLIGDPAEDTFILLSPASGGADDDKWANYPSWKKWTQPGGVHMLSEYLKILAPSQHWDEIVSNSKVESLSRISYLDKNEALSDKAHSYIDPSYRISHFDGYQCVQSSVETKSVSRKKPESETGNTVDGESNRIIAISDAGNGVRVEPDIWNNYLEVQSSSELIFLKRHLPLLADDGLWKAFANSLSQRVLLVSADDLRAEGMRLSRGLSWESVAHDLLTGLNNNESPLKKLTSKVNKLIVLFDVEAAFVVESNDCKNSCTAKLIFDPLLAEGDVEEKYPGSVYGKMNYFTARILSQLAVTLNLENFDLGDLVGNAMPGLQRYVQQPMHCEDLEKTKLLVSFDEVKKSKGREKENKPAKYVTVDIDLNKSSVCPSFISNVNVIELSENVVRLGVTALSDIPSASFGKFTTVDKGEIESYRAINKLIKGYQKNSELSKPISIAVFGAPGSGKSFGVKQLVDENVTPILTFNLSEADTDDLPGFFHEIRTEALKGKTPLCFFDEFDRDDCSLVSSFLAAMQDGEFREGARVHPTGRGIFVFAGGTSSSFSEFYKAAKEDRDLKYGKKLMDFVSRLSGYIDVKGPNESMELNEQEQQEVDRYLPLRRAILLRAIIENELGSIISSVSKIAYIDRGVLKAFLNTNKYKHGARSIEKIVKMCGQGQQKDRLSVSDFPHEDQLSLHVNSEEFLRHASAVNEEH